MLENPSDPRGIRPDESQAPWSADDLIRGSGQVVHDRPSPVVRGADIAQPSARVRLCPAAWQQYWQQSRRPALIADRPFFRPDISRVGADRAGVMRCRRSLLAARWPLPLVSPSAAARKRVVRSDRLIERNGHAWAYCDPASGPQRQCQLVPGATQPAAAQRGCQQPGQGVPGSRGRPSPARPGHLASDRHRATGRAPRPGGFAGVCRAQRPGSRRSGTRAHRCVAAGSSAARLAKTADLVGKSVLVWRVHGQGLAGVLVVVMAVYVAGAASRPEDIPGAAA
jgi:hypothetical protein